MKKSRFLGTLMLIVCMTGCGAASGGSSSFTPSGEPARERLKEIDPDSYVNQLENYYHVKTFAEGATPEEAAEQFAQVVDVALNDTETYTMGTDIVFDVEVYNSASDATIEWTLHRKVGWYEAEFTMIDSTYEDAFTKAVDEDKTIQAFLTEQERVQKETKEKYNGLRPGVYTADFFRGWRFNEDKTVIRYDAKWYKAKDKPTGCKPEYQYGTYETDGTSITITISGEPNKITGVITDDFIIIDGEECKLKTTPYAHKIEPSDFYTEDAQKEIMKEWEGLDEKLGLPKVEE